MSDAAIGAYGTCRRGGQQGMPQQTQPETSGAGIQYFNSFSTTSIKPFSSVAKIPTLLLNIGDAMEPEFFLLKEKIRPTVPPELPKIFADPLSMRKAGSQGSAASRSRQTLMNAASPKSPSAVRGATVSGIRGPPPARRVPAPTEDLSDIPGPSTRRPRYSARPVRPGENPPRFY